MAAANEKVSHQKGSNGPDGSGKGTTESKPKMPAKAKPC